MPKTFTVRRAVAWTLFQLGYTVLGLIAGFLAVVSILLLLAGLHWLFINVNVLGMLAILFALFGCRLLGQMITEGVDGVRHHD